MGEPAKKEGRNQAGTHLLDPFESRPATFEEKKPGVEIGRGGLEEKEEGREGLGILESR